MQFQVETIIVMKAAPTMQGARQRGLGEGAQAHDAVEIL
jgi:hypothetical protein